MRKEWERNIGERREGGKGTKVMKKRLKIKTWKERGKKKETKKQTNKPLEFVVVILHS
jgi:hypothetical protein